MLTLPNGKSWRGAMAAAAAGILLSLPAWSAPPVGERPVITARRATPPVVVDGKLDDEVWSRAESCPLLPPRSFSREQPAEPGEVKLAWDDEFLYVGARLQDSDIVQEDDRDQMRHFQTGDVLEVFLKPVANTWYWEMYATPNGRQATFFFPGPGRLGLPSCQDNPGLTMQVAATIGGTLNDWRDRDREWTVEIAIPMAALTIHGDRLAPGTRWHILLARYNYSRYLAECELSSHPRLSHPRFHLLNQYAELTLED